MKKLITATAVTAMLLVCSCSNGNAGAPDALIDSIVSEVSEQSGGDGVDLDLTVMNANMIYATVYNIVTEPEAYYGKTLKLGGYFDTSYDERLDTRYYFVVIPDATACCSQGLEFMCSFDISYPDDYPDPGTDIEVTGTLDRYDEEGHTYYYIKTGGIDLR